MSPALGVNQYGKSQVRMVRVDRTGPVHRFADLNVSVTLSGDLEAVHLSGSNANVVATDTQQNTIYAFAQEAPVDEIEAFALRLARHFVAAYTPISRARVRIESAAWQRIPVAGEPHPHAFVAAGSDRRVAEAVVDGPGGEWVISGVSDLVVLKSTGSEFWGFIRDEMTTLPETHDRILSTSVEARWRHGTAQEEPGAWNASFDAARAALLERFAELHSLSLQQTLFAMGTAVMEASPGIVEVRMSMPNRHHFTVNLEPFGLENPNLVFKIQDRPYGLIEGQILADEAPDAGPAWEMYPLL